MKNRRVFIMLLSLFSIFIVISYIIMNRRLKKGDVYPPYSSLRSDPLGTSIFRKAMKEMGYQTKILTEEKLPEEINPVMTALFLISPSSGITQESIESILEFIQNGGRVFLSGNSPDRLKEYFLTRVHSKKNIDDFLPLISLAKEKIKREDNYGREERPDKEKYVKSVIPGSAFDFPGNRLPVFNRSYLSTDWPQTLTVYSDGEHDIIILLSYGKGDIVISSESYLLSNECLLSTPPLHFLQWLIGGRGHILFDEYHHGLIYQKGISFLFIKYRLSWFIAYLCLIFCLYLWHIIPHFQQPLQMPPQENQKAFTPLQGYASLLMKSVPQRQLLGICWEEWVKGKESRGSQRGHEEIRQKIGASHLEKDEENIQLYNEICTMIKQSFTTEKQRKES